MQPCPRRQEPGGPRLDRERRSLGGQPHRTRADRGRWRRAMFYLSSVVRYKPSRIEESGKSEAPWILDAFSREAGPHLVRSALAGITGRLHTFRSPEALAVGVEY